MWQCLWQKLIPQLTKTVYKNYSSITQKEVVYGKLRETAKLKIHNIQRKQTENDVREQLE